ncbi:hypothetical protein SRHO_G00259520 [Serrasalmus rhombeus]
MPPDSQKRGNWTWKKASYKLSMQKDDGRLSGAAGWICKTGEGRKTSGQDEMAGMRKVGVKWRGERKPGCPCQVVNACHTSSGEAPGPQTSV